MVVKFQQITFIVTGLCFSRRYLAIEQIPFATPAGLTYSHPLPLPRLKSTQISTLNASFCFKIYASGKDVPEVNSFQATIKYSETGACVVNLLLKYRVCYSAYNLFGIIYMNAYFSTSATIRYNSK